MNRISPSDDPRFARLAFWLIGGLTLARFAANLASPLDLYADEAQYWRWGQTLEWGYYSKPPLIAWLLHGVTRLFGDSEPVIRSLPPFLHAVAAGALFLLGRDLFGARAGLFGALFYALMPAVTLSSGLISTDGVLMPFWCIALFCLWRMREGRNGWAAAVGLGLALGAGFLSKYAMMYFLIGMALAAVIDKPTRQALLSARGALALAIGALIFAPHMVWNAAHDFKTVSHTVDNAGLDGPLLNPEHALTFFVDQIGVFGPVAFLTLVFGLVLMRSGEAELKARERWLICFIVPVLIIILAQSILSRAHANWAVTAYPAANLLVANWLLRANANPRLWWIIGGLSFIACLLAPEFSLATRALIGAVLGGGLILIGRTRQYRPAALVGTSLGLHAFVAVFLTLAALLPAHTSSALGLDNSLKRSRGWQETSAQVYAAAQATGATAILVDEREVWHGFDYYGRTRTIPLISWRRASGPKSFSEAEPLAGPMAERVLVVSLHADLRPHLRSDFTSFEPAGRITVPLGKRSNGCPLTRGFQLYLASGFAPPPRTPEWEAQFVGKEEFPEPPCPAPAK